MMKRSQYQAYVGDEDDSDLEGVVVPLRTFPSRESSRTLSPEPMQQPDIEEPAISCSSRPIPQQKPSFATKPSQNKRPRTNDGLRAIFAAQEPKAGNNEYHGSENHQRSGEIIDLEELEAKLEIEIVMLEDEVFRPTILQSNRCKVIPRRNPPIDLPWIAIDEHFWKGSILRESKTVEVSDGSFLKITTVLMNLETDEVRVRGLQLKRARQLGGMLQKKTNEVCFIYVADQTDDRSAHEQSIAEFGLDNVLRIRKLICTNRPYPECRFKDEDLPISNADKTPMSWAERIKWAEVHAVLVARWKFTSIYRTPQHRLSKTSVNFQQHKFEFLAENECSNGQFALRADAKRWDWRGDTVLGGAYTGGDNLNIEDSMLQRQRTPLAERKIPNSPNLAEIVDLSLDSDNEDEVHTVEKDETHRHLKSGHASQPPRSKISAAAPLSKEARAFQKYTFGDSFCGAGGTTRGAVLAGLHLVWGLDSWSEAEKTWKANFPKANFVRMPVDEICRRFDSLDKLKVDILHVSTPCQFFSPAHTRPGKNDEANFATLFSVGPLIDKSGPRIVTLEQTFGILYSEHKLAFNQLIRMFTDRGFSVSWQVAELQKFGLPQRRKRLIVIASCPGERLPEFPAYTHSETGGNGLKRYTSVASVLSKIPGTAANHDIQAVHNGKQYTPWDASGILPRCITTGGADNHIGHPTGKRKFTLRELAVLQGYPRNHIFGGQYIGTQIGNAYPSSVAKTVFEHIIKHLEKLDNAELQAFEVDG